MDDKTKLNLTHLMRPAIERLVPGKSAPGLVLLHGRGSDEADLMALEGALDPRFTIVSVRAPYRLGPGWTWYGMPGVGRPDPDTFHASLGELREFVEALPAAYNVDPQSLYLFGFSQGSMMASSLAILAPELVRGVVMHSGYVPAAMKWNADLAKDLRPEGLAAKPFFVAHGEYDDVLPVALGRASQAFLKEAGAEVTYREYPIGHSISEESLYDLSEWLTARLDAS